MKCFCCIILCLIIQSCEQFKVKKTTPEAILNEELQTFNWKTVDVYPSFMDCDSMLVNEEKKSCFESTLYTEINAFLQEQTIVVNHDINDTLQLQLQVSAKGAVELLEFNADSTTKAQLPELKQLLLRSLNALPPIQPAIKRGQPVTVAFEMPLIIRVN